MSVTSITFPLSNNRPRRRPPVGQHLPLNNQRHHPAPSHPHALNPTASDSLFPPLPSIVGGSSKPRPYHLNDFANNSLFLAKRKIAQAFNDPTSKETPSSTDLLYLFDQHESKYKSRSTSKPRRHVTLVQCLSSTVPNEFFSFY